MIHRIQIGRWVMHTDNEGMKQLNDAIDALVKEGWADPREPKCGPSMMQQLEDAPVNFPVVYDLEKEQAKGQFKNNIKYYKQHGKKENSSGADKGKRTAKKRTKR